MSDKTTIDDGGPAFPGGVTDCFIDSPHGGKERASAYGFQPVEGMSLRDWFAGMAIYSAVASSADDSDLEWIAGRAYRIADAMISARKSGAK